MISPFQSCAAGCFPCTERGSVSGYHSHLPDTHDLTTFAFTDDGTQMAVHHPLPITPHTHTLPTVTNHNLPPYEQTGMESAAVQPVRGGEGRREEGGRGGGGNMNEYTSSEEIHVAAMEGVKSSQMKKLVSPSKLTLSPHYPPLS